MNSHASATKIPGVPARRPLGIVSLPVLVPPPFSCGQFAPTFTDGSSPALSRHDRINVKEVFRFAVTNFREVIEDAMTKTNLMAQSVGQVVCHQSNVRIIKAALQKCFVASTDHGVIAFVGHASIHRVHDPHGSPRCGKFGAAAFDFAVVPYEASKTHDVLAR